MMEQRALGKTGLSVSALGFGAGAVGGLMVRGDPAEQVRAVGRAIEAGMTYFDTAPLYGQGRSEENLGRALGELGAWDQVVVGTKVRPAPADLKDAPNAIRRSLETSLRRLGRDHVDLFQLHNDVVLQRGETGDALSLERVLSEVAETMQRMVEQGLVRHIGFTGLGDPAALREVARGDRFEAVQTYFNPVNPSAGFAGASGGGQDFQGLIDVAAERSLGVIAIRVFAAGALAGTAERASNAGPPVQLTAGGSYERDLERARRLQRLAEELGLESGLELALRFALSTMGVSTALVGYSTLAQLESAIRWAERGPLPEDAVRRVVEMAT